MAGEHPPKDPPLTSAPPLEDEAPRAQAAHALGRSAAPEAPEGLGGAQPSSAHMQGNGSPYTGDLSEPALLTVAPPAATTLHIKQGLSQNDPAAAWPLGVWSTDPATTQASSERTHHGRATASPPAETLSAALSQLESAFRKRSLDPEDYIKVQRLRLRQQSLQRLLTRYQNQQLPRYIATSKAVHDALHARLAAQQQSTHYERFAGKIIRLAQTRIEAVKMRSAVERIQTDLARLNAQIQDLEANLFPLDEADPLLVKLSELQQLAQKKNLGAQLCSPSALATARFPWQPAEESCTQANAVCMRIDQLEKDLRWLPVTLKQALKNYYTAPTQMDQAELLRLKQYEDQLDVLCAQEDQQLRVLEQKSNQEIEQIITRLEASDAPSSPSSLPPASKPPTT